ncbi:SusD/RagB family nutrient-binding outer membrane lipoprotein [Thalassobellus suaedae]|uniref:SusD/RagB family nutrient-binding outer membrane lipoprotein n=1 Tax=Thalassobellus suaedae TaxID=3074124 RepID=A0ABY9XQ89_9FLAO|nr:SusD/RagB family nutrient-binding outer membrane lipoprotein [Flavobacteriaceae bacterium HL-DH14]
MKKYILKFILAFLTIFAISCESYLDINQDPNVLSDTDQPKILLPNAQVGLANTLMGYDLGFGGAFWTQYWTQSYTASQFKTLCEYEETSFNDAYVEFTAVVLNDLKRMQTLSEDIAENQGYSYIAEALSIYTWQIMTDLWGDIPYSEALQGNEGITAPKFDASEEIYADLEKRIDALLTIDVSEFAQIDAKFDFIYAGDFDAWKKFANSLKLKLMMRQSETSNYNNSTVVSFVTNNLFIDESAKISGEIWEDGKEGKRHPMREFQEGGANTLSTNVIGCKSFIDYLNSNSDPRIDALFTPPSEGHQGAFFGDFDSKKDSDLDGTLDEDEDYSEALFAGDTDLIIISDWEVNFFIAEVYARANDLVNAKKYYDMGVTTSLAQNGISTTDIISTGYAIWVDGTLEENLKQIAMQKWVANANYQHLESFLERNRTKYPALNPLDIKQDRNFAFLNFPIGDLTNSVNGRDKTNAKLPSSPVYPSDVLGRNINAPSQKTDLLQKVWWDKKVGN